VPEIVRILAACVVGAACLPSPAKAGAFSLAIGMPGAVAFDYGSGGYCDRLGCPDAYWADPIWYGPVYYDGVWYQGPVYYRDENGRRRFWVHGGWQSDEWRGPRPAWWSPTFYHTGPALGLAYYRNHGFRIPQHQWDYWHAHGGYAWEKSHGVDWRRDYAARGESRPGR